MSAFPLQQEIERFNRASEFFGDPVERWNNRLSLERNVQVENYRRGRMALVLDCEFTAPRILNSPLVEPNAAGLIHEVGVLGKMNRALIILKANISEHHHLQHWNKKFVFIPYIQPVKCPEGVITSLVGLYPVQNKTADIRKDLLLFQSAIYGSFQFFPGVEYWEASPIRSLSVALNHNLVPQEVKRASKIVQSISQDHSDVICGKRHIIESDMQMNKVPAVIEFNADGMKIVRSDPLGENRFNIRDVLLGPVNLQY
jgi:hypothetical protein